MKAASGAAISGDSVAPNAKTHIWINIIILISLTTRNALSKTGLPIAHSASEHFVSV